MRHVRETIGVMEKQSVLHMLGDCVCVTLVIQHLKLMRLIVLSFVACLALPHFSTFSHNRHDFLKKKLMNMCALRDWSLLQLY